MVEPEEFLNRFRSAGVEFISGVPDTLLNDLCLAIGNTWPSSSHTIAANEGTAIAMAAGQHLATDSVPLVYMQNSGLGNALNPIASLLDVNVYAIPLVLLIGWRGHPNEVDWLQHRRQGAITTRLLSDLGVPHRIIGPHSTDALDDADWAVQSAKDRSGPTALLVTRGVFDRGAKSDFSDSEGEFRVSREEAIAGVLDVAPSDSVVVATTGRASRELSDIRSARGEGLRHDFLNIGAMGHASALAAGIALGRPNRTVICLDGDAAVLMHMGSLAINASLNLKNFIHIVLNNGSHESVGGQPSLGHRVDLTAVAAAVGYQTSEGPTNTVDGLQGVFRKLMKRGGPAFIDMRIRRGMRRDMPKLIFHPAESKSHLMDGLR